MSRHFAILGAGALGTILGAHLSRDGHEVTMVARGQRALSIRQQGLRLSGLADFSARCRVIDNPAELKEADVFIVAIKALNTEASLVPFAHAEVGAAFSIQNGVQKDEQLEALFGSGRVLGGMADISGELQPNGVVAFTRNVNIHLGEFDGGRSARLTGIVHAISASGVNARAADNILSVEWSKFTGWMGLMAMAVMAGTETWRFLTDPDMALVIARAVREAGRLPAALNIPLIDISPMPVATIIGSSEAAAVEAIHKVGQELHTRAPDHRVSSMQDFEAGRKLEVDETLGYAVRRAHAMGLELPVLNTCWRVIAGLDRLHGS